jgi:homoserine dehydrogenase
MGVTLLFEASVGGAMHILEPLYQFSKHNKIHTIKGIINGSTNFILSKIFLEDYSYMQALGEADELGYIETGTTDDMDGLDLMRKINIASMISFDTEIKEEDITLVPLSSLTSEFYDYVKTQKKLIKYVATSKKQGQHISIHLEPVIIETGMLQHIHYEDNIIMLYGEYHRKQSFVGQGAGRYPTASAIINDILLIKNKNKRTFDTSKAYEINQFEELFDFIVQTKDDFKFMEKRSIQSLLDDPNIICFARMGGDLS